MNYWYISLSKNYPPKITRQVELHRHYAVVECIQRVNKKEMVALELNFLGYGFYKDNHIQENLTHKKGVFIMKELIKVSVNENDEQLVSGRELHEFCWLERLINDGLNE